MRLGQLARKISKRPAELSAFLLERHQISIDSGSNTRLDDEHVKLIVLEFAPEQYASVTNQLNDEDEAVTEINEGVSPTNDIEHVESIKEEVEATPEEKSESIEETLPLEETIELIKAPKIELPGLRIVGKIDLPEPKKKEPEQTSEEVDAKKTENTREFKRRDNRERYPRKNPVALQRERELKEEERRKEKEALLRKEKKTNNYLKKVKSNAPSNTTKKKKVKVMEMHQPVKQKARKEPATLLQKFARWLFRE